MWNQSPTLGTFTWWWTTHKWCWWLSSNPSYLRGRLAPTEFPWANHQGCFTHPPTRSIRGQCSPPFVAIGSMYGIFTNIYHKNHPNVGKYSSTMDPSWGSNPCHHSLHGFLPEKSQGFRALAPDAPCPYLAWRARAPPRRCSRDPVGWKYGMNHRWICCDWWWFFIPMTDPLHRNVKVDQLYGIVSSLTGTLLDQKVE